MNPSEINAMKSSVDSVKREIDLLGKKFIGVLTFFSLILPIFLIVAINAWKLVYWSIMW